MKKYNILYSKDADDVPAMKIKNVESDRERVEKEEEPNFDDETRKESEDNLINEVDYQMYDTLIDQELSDGE